MNSLDLGTFWERILERTKTMLPLPVWEKVIHSGLFPFTFENDVLTLCSMQDYIKNLAENNPAILSSLERATEDIERRKISIVIGDPSSLMEPAAEKDTAQTIDSPPALTSHKSNYTSPINSEVPPESLSFETTTADLDSTDFIRPVYNKPVYINSAENKDILSPLETKEALYIPSETQSPEYQLTPSTKEEEYIPVSLNENYTFDTFVVGNTNRIAYATAQAVAETPAEKFNPLFIYGESGLGKTHLMHAIGHYIIDHHPNLRIMCISSETFLNDFIQSISSKKGEKFRFKYRNIDVLMIDDIQFFQDKDSTQTEFFHTYNSLYNDKKQIILTSDTLPANMKNVEKRLLSRFEAGCVVTIEPPDLETRIAILRSKADYEIAKNPALQISNDTINYIASSVDTNIRSLEGAFNNVLMNASLSNEAVTSEYAYTILKNTIGERKSKHISVSYIQEFIASYFKIKKDDLLGQKRTKQLAYPRQIAMYLCRELINASYPSIAESFGKKDHTTVLHAYEKIDRESRNNDETNKMIKDIIDKLNGPA